MTDTAGSPPATATGNDGGDPPFATVDELRSYTDTPDLDADRAQLILTAISDEIRDVLGWPVTAQTGVTRVLDGSGDVRLLLPTRWLTGVSQVIENGVALTAADYLPHPHGYLIRLHRQHHHRWTCREQAVAVTYDHGYPPGEVPGVFKTVTLETAGRLLANPGGALKSATSGRESLTYADIRAQVPAVDDARLTVYQITTGL